MTLASSVAMDRPGPGSVCLPQNGQLATPVMVDDTVTAEAGGLEIHSTKPVCNPKINVSRQTGWKFL